jgi:hypothetical protein
VQNSVRQRVRPSTVGETVKRLIALLILALVLTVGAADPVRIQSPASTGWNYTADITELALTDAYWLQNVDLWSTPGAVRPRYSLRSVGNGSLTPKSVEAYYNSERIHRLLWGVVADTNLFTTTRKRSDSTTQTFSGGSRYKLNHTNTNGTDISYGTVTGVTPIFPNAPSGMLPYYDWTTYNNISILSDGRSQPWMMSSLRSFKKGPDTTIFTGVLKFHDDTLAFSPKGYTLGLLAPGQPRAQVYNIKRNGGTAGRGYYQYRYRYSAQGDTTLWGKPSIASAVVWSDSQAVALSCFEGQAFYPNGTNGNLGDYYCRVIVERNYNSAGWKTLDTILFKASDTFVYVDSFPLSKSSDTVTTVRDSLPQPGAPCKFGNLQDTVYKNVGWGTPFLYVESLKTYWSCYSYYDPATNMESPLGPMFRCDSLVSQDTDLVVLYKGYTNLANRPGRIRVYRSAGNDSTVLYGLFETSSQTPFSTNNYMSMALRVGYVPDSALVDLVLAYQDTAKLPQGTYLFDDGGGLVIRPPFLSGCALQLTDVAEFNGRLFGVGDPLYPSRLYYTEYDQPGEWPVTNYIDLEENSTDPLIRLIKPDESNVLYAFKHGKIFAITGYDVAYDLQFQPISSSIGAVNAKSVCKYQGSVYFVGNDRKVYRLNGGALQSISEKIDAFIKSSAWLTTYWSAETAARLFVWNENLMFSLDVYGFTLQYECLYDRWQIFQSQSNNRYLGAFTYDSTGSYQGVGARDGWLYGSNLSRYLVEENDRGTDSCGDTAYSYSMIYQTPFFGDGRAMWSIPYCGFTFPTNSGRKITVAAYGQEGSPVSDTIRLSVSSDLSSYEKGLPYNVSKYVSVRITCDTTRSGMILRDLWFMPERGGYAPIK